MGGFQLGWFQHPATTWQTRAKKTPLTKRPSQETRCSTRRLLNMGFLRMTVPYGPQQNGSSETISTALAAKHLQIV
ncbi:MAG: hypothetical protein CMJ70_25125 [Planctomycetaceae bacterium]|nr:hypothetical protein [Planctomycetaceae bacterium]HAA68364.1 hypothetical protein [Planctomycetaceae bacterium]